MNETNWNEIKSAHRMSEKVPILFDRLKSDVPETRQDALSILFETIWHQGTVFEASLYSIPVLLSMLRNPDVSEKSGIAILVASIGCGRSVDSTVRQSRRSRDTGCEVSKSDRISVVDPLEHAIHEEIRPGLSLLTTFLDNPEPEVRGVIAELLSTYSERKDESIQALQRSIVNEQDGFTRSRFEQAILVLSKN